MGTEGTTLNGFPTTVRTYLARAADLRRTCQAGHRSPGTTVGREEDAHALAARRLRTPHRAIRPRTHLHGAHRRGGFVRVHPHKHPDDPRAGQVVARERDARRHAHTPRGLRVGLLAHGWHR